MCGDLHLEKVPAGEVRHIRKNKDVVVAGRHYGTVFVNHDGWLFRYKILHNGDRQIVDFVLPGQIFGLQACLFKASLYSTTAITDASVSSIPLDVIDQVFDRNPELAKALFWSAVCEAAIVGEHLIDTACRSAYERVAHLLLELRPSQDSAPDRRHVVQHAANARAHWRCAWPHYRPREPHASFVAQRQAHRHPQQVRHDPGL